MIAVRAPQYAHLLPPPWLDPNRLGATGLKYVPAAALRIIDGGTDGVLKYLSSTTAHQEPAEAFVLRRAGGVACVYLREQFWIAANLLLEVILRERRQFSLADWMAEWDESRNPRALAEFFLSPRPAGSIAGRTPLDLAQRVFDVHEYAECAQ